VPYTNAFKDVNLGGNNLTNGEMLSLIEGAGFPSLRFGTHGNITFYDATGNTFRFNHGIYIDGGTNDFLDIGAQLLVGTYARITDYLTIGNYLNVSTNISLGDKICTLLGVCYSLTDLNATSTYYADETFINKNASNSFNFNNTKMNETIDEKIATIYYNVSSIVNARGTGAGALAYINTYDNNPYNVTEQAGAVGLDLRLNFTGITNINRLIFRYKTTAGESHTIKVQIYDYDLGDWENYATLAEVIDYNTKEIGIYDADEHIEGGVVALRFYQADNGNINHIHYFDWVQLAQGVSTASGAEVDPFSVHKSTVNLTQFELDGVFNINISYLLNC
jgi:hypothetical protein